MSLAIKHIPKLKLPPRTFRVKEYFVIDPNSKETLGFYHDGKKYIQQQTKTRELTSQLLKKSFSF